MTDYIFESDQAPIMYVIDLKKASEFTSGNFKIGENLTNFEILHISPAKVSPAKESCGFCDQSVHDQPDQLVL